MKQFMCRNDIIEDMSTVKLLDEKTRKRWTAIFVGVVVCIAITCISIMNIHYDELARYPYKDERSRELIKEYLNKEEIDYIIEYSIAPNVFISFIQADDFNIYHATEYKKLSEVMWMESPEHIVEMVEKTRNAMDIDTLARYLEHYTFNDIDRVCESLSKYKVQINKLPFELQKDTKIMVEAKEDPILPKPKFDDEVDNQLAYLAQL